MVEMVGGVLSQRDAMDQKVHDPCLLQPAVVPRGGGLRRSNWEMLAGACSAGIASLAGGLRAYLRGMDGPQNSGVSAQARWALFLGRFNFILIYCPM